MKLIFWSGKNIHIFHFLCLLYSHFSSNTYIFSRIDKTKTKTKKTKTKKNLFSTNKTNTYSIFHTCYGV